jgi:UDPglucose 6-dehydrogenase
VASANAAAACPELRYSSSIQEAAAGAIVVLLVTEWPEFTTLLHDDLYGLVKRKNIVDARNALTPAAWLELPGARNRRRQRGDAPGRT